MARYKLRVPTSGDWLYGDGDSAVVANTREEARQYFQEERDEPAPYVHSHIGRCRVLYKRDVENDFVFDGAEPGDTQIDYCHDDGRELASNECRVWMLGPPPVDWRMESLPPEEITADTIPPGTSAYHKRIGQGKTVAPGYVVGKRWFIDVAFKRFERGQWVTERILACSLATIGILPGRDWPPRKYRLTVAGEFIAEGTERVLEGLRAIRIDRLNAEWEAEQDRELVARA